MIIIMATAAHFFHHHATLAQDAADPDDRKRYYEVVRAMWNAKNSLQAQELELLQQLKHHQDVKASLRAQLLEKQQALLQFGASISRRTCLCPVQACASLDIRLQHRTHLSRAGLSCQQHRVCHCVVRPPFVTSRSLSFSSLKRASALHAT